MNQKQYVEHGIMVYVTQCVIIAQGMSGKNTKIFEVIIVNTELLLIVKDCLIG